MLTNIGCLGLGLGGKLVRINNVNIHIFAE